MDGLFPLINQLHSACQDLPEAVQRQARRLLLDTWGCMLAGRRDPIVAQFEHTWSAHDRGNVTFPEGPGLSVGASALVAATAACWDEACEGHAGAHGRPGVAVFAAIYPFIEQRSLGDVLRAYTLGYEVCARAGALLRIREGMHVDGNWPALGAAASVACLLNLPPAQIAQAVNAAACQLPMSLYWPVRQGANIRNTYLGHAAQTGQLAALAVASGLNAPDNATQAYARVALGDAPIQWPAFQQFEIASAYIKPFAAVRHVHYGATCAQVLHDQVDPQRVESIQLRVYEEAMTYCGNRAPAGPLQAQFSLSFGIAAMLRHGRLDPAVYREPLFSDPLLHRLESLVSIDIDQAMSLRAERGCHLAITLDDGRVLQHAFSSVVGDAACPMPDDMLATKFESYAIPTLGQTAAREHSHVWLEADLQQPMSSIFFNS